MVKIRLQRKGRKNAPAYRIVSADAKAKRDGRFLEILGYYNPTQDPKKVEYKKDRYKYWISIGAQPTRAVSKLISGKYKYIPYTSESKQKEEIPKDDAPSKEKQPKVEEKIKNKEEVEVDKKEQKE